MTVELCNSACLESEEDETMASDWSTSLPAECSFVSAYVCFNAQIMPHNHLSSGTSLKAYQGKGFIVLASPGDVTFNIFQPSLQDMVP